MKGSVFTLSLIVVIAFGGLFFYQQRQALRPAGHRLHVVTTFLPLYVFTKNVVGNVADVSNLVPPGTDIHDYSLTPSDAAALIEADVVVKNGYGLDDFIDDVIKTNAAPNHTTRIIDAGILVDSTRPGLGASSPEGTYATTADKTVANKFANPHIWVNPAYAIHMVEAIRNGLMAADPKNASAYAVNAEVYLERLLTLDGKFRAATLRFDAPNFVAEEQSMTYLAQEYRLNQLAILGNEPETSLSPKDIANMTKLMKENRITVMFKNLSSAGTVMNTIAKDAKAKVYTFDAFETGEMSNDAYELAMEKNLATLTQAFGK